MKISILTLFPDMFTPLKESIIGRAVSDGKLEIEVVNIRDFSEDKHKKCDDYPFGGGAGMVMMPQPIASCVQAVDPEHKALRLYTSPKGKRLDQQTVLKLAERDYILILCGHYEGVDQRVLDKYFDGEISIGDYVLTGGELPAMVICDAVARYVGGVLSAGSLVDESFSDGRLEYTQYTRPAVFEGESVPEVLLSGNHAEIDKWRMEQSEAITAARRPDMIKKK